jgi:hypothetical protein
MRMTKALIVAVALLGFGVASAQEYVQVERRESTAGTVLRNTVAGGLVGSAVAGGVILYEMGIEDNDDYDWGRTLAWGAVIGLGAGLVWGIVDAASGPDLATRTRLARAPVRDGNSLTLDVRRKDMSGRQMMPLLAGRF